MGIWANQHIPVKGMWMGGFCQMIFVAMQKGEPMNDLISRQAAIAVADSSDYVGLSVDDVKKVTDEVVKGLKQLPSAQPDLEEDEDIPMEYFENGGI